MAIYNIEYLIENGYILEALSEKQKKVIYLSILGSAVALKAINSIKKKHKGKFFVKSKKEKK